MSKINNTHDRGIATVCIMDTFLKKLKRNEVFIENQFHKSKVQWDEETKSNLVVSILNDYQFPAIVIAKIVKSGFAYPYVIDGIQRINTFLEFKNNSLKIHKNSQRAIVEYVKQTQNENGEVVDKLENFDLRGKFYKDLPEELQDIFDNYNLHIDIYSPCTEDDIKFHIKRYNSTILYFFCTDRESCK